MRVHFIDAGFYHGDTTRMFRDLCRGLGLDYAIDAFEAHPAIYAEHAGGFSEDPAIHVHQVALGETDGPVPLFLSQRPSGHSLRADRDFVRKRQDKQPVSVTVPGIRLSTWLRGQLSAGCDLRILKLNIEGAEWRVLEDLASAGLHTAIDLYLGTPGAESDIHKIQAYRGRYDQYVGFCEAHGIFMQRFTSWQPERNYDLAGYLRRAQRLFAAGDPGWRHELRKEPSSTGG